MLCFFPMRRRDKSSAYKGRENNSMSLLRIGRKKPFKIEDFNNQQAVCPLYKSFILKSIIGKQKKEVSVKKGRRIL